MPAARENETGGFMRLYLIRHGQTDWNRDRKIMGTGAIPLNEQGRSCVAALAEFLTRDGIPVIFSSTVARARESAEILAETWKAELHEEPGFNESDYERWVGKKFSELAGDPEFELYSTSPSRSQFSDTEGMKDIQQRALDAVQRIVDGAASPNGGYERAAAVSHSDVIKPVIAHYLGMDLDDIHRLAIANASASMIDFGYPRKPRVRYLNLMPWKWR
jgi:broad specificity phosphatase PhoE